MINEADQIRRQEINLLIDQLLLVDQGLQETLP